MVAAIQPSVAVDDLALAVQKFATLIVAKHPDELTTVFRIALRGKRAFVDWLRNNPHATVIAPYSLRARPRAPVATPLAWSELETTAPDAFSIDDVERLLERPDALLEIARTPSEPERFVTGVHVARRNSLSVTAVGHAFAESGLELEVFDRFRS